MRLLLAAALLATALPSLAKADDCRDTFKPVELTQLKKQEFEVADAHRRNQTALQLLACLGDPDPAIRDGVVYEALSHWLRGKQLTPETVKTLYRRLTGILQQPDQDTKADTNSFTRPFAALLLAEVVRVDRITPYLDNKERQQTVDLATAYMKGIVDYRGFDDNSGWRHAVAHTADLFLQLSLNPQINKGQLDQLLAALKRQIAPGSGHFYTYGEPKRLAMPFIYIVLRGLHTPKELAAYLNSIADPAPFEDWRGIYQSNQGLAKLHNTRSFIYSLVATTGQSQNTQLQAIQPTLAKIVKTLG